MSFRASGATRNFLASESKGKNLFHFAECRRKSAPLNLPVILNGVKNLLPYSLYPLSFRANARNPFVIQEPFK